MVEVLAAYTLPGGLIVELEQRDGGDYAAAVFDPAGQDWVFVGQARRYRVMALLDCLRAAFVWRNIGRA